LINFVIEFNTFSQQLFKYIYNYLNRPISQILSLKEFFYVKVVDDADGSDSGLASDRLTDDPHMHSNRRNTDSTSHTDGASTPDVVSEKHNKDFFKSNCHLLRYCFQKKISFG